MKKPPSQRPERQLPPGVLVVGKPYSTSRREWPQGADYNFRDGAHELRIFLPQASKAEIEAVESGKIEFGLIVDQPDLFVISRFWHASEKRLFLSFDCSYSWHRVAPESRTNPPAWEETSPELRALCTIILVEATTGIVLALRACSYSPEFTQAIHRAIAEQSAMPYDRADHEGRVDAKVRAFDTRQLWEQCKVRCTGGD